MAYTREDLEHLWYADFFPSTRAWMEASHPPLARILEWLPGAERLEVRFTDLEDASLAALAAHPQKVLDDRWRRQTSFFERLEREHPDELREGLARLARDVTAGRAPAGRPVASVLRWVAAAAQ
jgi:inorganic triphosphatase YgiF